MAETDQNNAEVQRDHEDEYHPEGEYEIDHEIKHGNATSEDKQFVDDGVLENFIPNEEPNYTDEPGVIGEKWPGWPGESVFRILVPAQKVGSIIGRKGEYVKKTCEETRSRIKILDGPPGVREKAVMVSAKEEFELPLPPAIDGLLKVHRRVVEGLENESSLPLPSSGAKTSTRLLVPAAQAGSLIGKQGATVKSIQEESNSIVRVLGSEELPIFALPDDRVVEIVGKPASIHKAVELIASHLRKFLLDRSVIPIIEMLMQTPNSHVEHMPPAQPWGLPNQSFPPNPPGGPGYGASPHFLPPPRSYDSYYPPADVPPENQPHQGISAYGREAPIPMHSSSVPPAPSVITQITQQLQIPLSYADAVIGTQGASISYIRRVSGATITIQESRGVPGEMTVEISGTASQVQTAQQLIQNFMAEAAGTAPAQMASSVDQGYSSYGDAQGSLYTSQPPNSNIPGQPGGYGSGYGYMS